MIKRVAHRVATGLLIATGSAMLAMAEPIIVIIW